MQFLQLEGKMIDHSKVPFISITDFMTRRQVICMLEVFENLGLHRTPRPRRLGVGVMTSHKVLNGLPTKWSQAFPKPEDISKIFLDNPYLFNVVHYADFEPTVFEVNLNRIVRLGGENLEAIQLDMTWPDPKVVSRFHQRHSRIKMVLQVGTHALEEVDNDPQKMAERLLEYGDSIHYVLLDKSMGRGMPLSSSVLFPFCYTVKDCFPEVGLVVAGGLGPETMILAQPLADAFEDLSIDAQGRLRPSHSALDPIDWDIAAEYLSAAKDLLTKQS